MAVKVDYGSPKEDDGCIAESTSKKKFAISCFSSIEKYLFFFCVSSLADKLNYEKEAVLDMAGKEVTDAQQKVHRTHSEWRKSESEKTDAQMVRTFQFCSSLPEMKTIQMITYSISYREMLLVKLYYIVSPMHTQCKKSRDYVQIYLYREIMYKFIWSLPMR